MPLPTHGQAIAAALVVGSMLCPSHGAPLQRPLDRDATQARATRVANCYSPPSSCFEDASGVYVDELCGFAAGQCYDAFLGRCIAPAQTNCFDGWKDSDDGSDGKWIGGVNDWTNAVTNHEMKCKNPVQSWKNVGDTECLNNCKSFAIKSGYTKTFCCAYNKGDKKCMVSADGRAKTKSDTRWKKAKGKMQGAQ